MALKEKGERRNFNLNCHQKHDNHLSLQYLLQVNHLKKETFIYMVIAKLIWNLVMLNEGNKILLIYSIT